jgi:hypothetical protein
VRGFYARGDTWRPMWIGTAVAVAAARSTTCWASWYGVIGLAIAGAIGMKSNALGHARLPARVVRRDRRSALARTVARASRSRRSLALRRRRFPPLGVGRSGAFARRRARRRAVRRSSSLVGIHSRATTRSAARCSASRAGRRRR